MEQKSYCGVSLYVCVWLIKSQRCRRDSSLVCIFAEFDKETAFGDDKSVAAKPYMLCTYVCLLIYINMYICMYELCRKKYIFHTKIVESRQGFQFNSLGFKIVGSCLSPNSTWEPLELNTYLLCQKPMKTMAN